MIETPQLSVSAIKHGSVIDHLSPGTALKVVQILRMDRYRHQITIGLNLPSSRMGFKDLIKVEEWALSPEEVNRVALLAPQATLAIIEEFQVVKKFALVLPESFEGLIVCPNRCCVTNHEQIPSQFYTSTIGSRVQLRCGFCSKVVLREEIQQSRI